MQFLSHHSHSSKLQMPQVLHLPHSLIQQSQVKLAKPQVHHSFLKQHQSQQLSHNFSKNSDLVSILAEAISAIRLPTPELALFTGDPLKFKDCQSSFETLIERKNIPKKERLYYLRKYLGGSAKKAVEGFLLVGTDEAYDGDPLTIGKCFRDKLHSWPKISSKDGCELNLQTSLKVVKPQCDVSRRWKFSMIVWRVKGSC